MTGSVSHVKFMDGVQLSQGYRATTKGDSLLFTTRSPGLPGTHLVNLRRMKSFKPGTLGFP